MRTVEHPITLLGYVCLVCVTAALVLIGRYLWKRPALDFRNKLWLLLGLGILPGMSAATSTVTGMQTTTERHFCGSCHVMDPYVSDAMEPTSQSLAARHGRNPFFGDRNCYVCHADYGMLGYPMTKLNGLRHVYMYYIAGWRHYSIERALDEIHLAKPYDNTNCRQCHTGTLADWASVPEHVSLKAELDSNAVSCASSGCHGYAHPFSKKDGHGAGALPPSAVGADGTGSSAALPSAAAEKLEAARAEASAEAQRKADEAQRAKDAAKDAAKAAAKERTK